MDIIILLGVLFGCIWIATRLSRKEEPGWRPGPRQHGPPDDIWPAARMTGAADSPREADGRFRARGAAPKGARKQRPRFDVTYVNGRGEVSTRRLRVHEMQFIAETRRCTYLTAHCDLRGERLMFRADRILKMVDLQTGEVVADPPAHLVTYAGDILSVHDDGKGQHTP